jgi:hypothetical protein
MSTRTFVDAALALTAGRERVAVLHAAMIDRDRKHQALEPIPN